MSLLAATRAFFGRGPWRLNLELTTVCNLRCAHCGIWRWKADPQALTLDEWTQALRALCPPTLSFMSGEPLLSPHLFPLVAEARRLGTRVSLTTNGTRIDTQAVNALKGTRVFVSLDAVNPALHDSGRGVPGTWEKASQAAKLLGARLNCIIAAHNLDEFEPLLNWARSQGLPGVNFQALFDFGENWKEFWPQTPLVHAALDRLIALKRSGAAVLNTHAQLLTMKRYYAAPQSMLQDESCGTDRVLTIKNDGRVYHCHYLDPIGHIRRGALADLWASPEALGRRTEIAACKKPCMLLNCHYVAVTLPRLAV